MSVLKLLAKENYIVFNKNLARKIGVNASIVFGALCSVAYMFNDNEFYYQKEKIEYDTCLGSDAVRNALKKLNELELISIIKKGLPCKNYYRINEDVFLQLINEDTTTDMDFEVSSSADTPTTTDMETPTTFKKNLKKEFKQKNLNNNSDSKSPLFDYISEFTDNEELKSYLNKYLQMKLKTTKGFMLEQWDLMLHELKKLSNNDTAKMIEIVKFSYMNNYRGFYPPKEQNKYNSANTNYINRQQHKQSEIDYSQDAGKMLPNGEITF